MPDETGPQRPSEGRAPNAQLVQIKLRLQALTERVDEHDELRGQVAAVAETIERLAAQQQVAKPAPAHWPAMGDDEYAARWAELLGWLRDVLAARYPADARKLTPCWRKHPAAVDALTAAWLTWQAAYLNRAADARDAASWHTQWRPQLLELVRVELNDCRGVPHQAPVMLDPTLLATFDPITGR